jgi:hypothetical protein
MSVRGPQRVTRFDDSQEQLIDAWRRAQPVIPTFSEALRILTMIGLKAEKEGAAK